MLPLSEPQKAPSLFNPRGFWMGSRIYLQITGLILSFVLITFLLPSKQQNSLGGKSMCPPCTGLRDKWGNSTQDDLIIAGIFGGGSRVMPFLRTLRSVGSRASVVLLTNLTKDDKSIESFNDCDAELFHVEVNESMMGLYPHSLRYIGAHQYLTTTTRKFNRIFHTDSFDVFFQKDPFTSDIKKDYLYFVLEEPLIKDSTWNTGWMERAYGKEVAAQMGNYTVSCSGTVIGGADQFRIYLDTLLGHQPFWNNGRHSLDQAYHNYLLHTGTFERNGIHPKYLGCNSSILTMHYCSRHKERIKYGRVFSPDGLTMPSVVHQYNLFSASSKLLKDLCDL